MSGDFPAAPVIRPAQAADMGAIQAIYAHHVTTGFGSFEEVAPSLEEMQRRFSEISGRGYPFLVAEDRGVVVGYTYGNHFRTRTAYRFTVEDSVYVAHDRVGQGIGRLLLGRLVEECEARGYHQMIAMIGDSTNHASMSLHGSCGFHIVGVIEDAGFKHGRWVDSVIMQRGLGRGPAEYQRSE